MGAAIPVIGLVLIFFSISTILLVFSGAFEKRKKTRILTGLGAMPSRLLPNNMVERYKRLLVLAGSPRGMSVEALLGAKLLAVPVAILLTWGLGALFGDSIFSSLLFKIPAVIAFSFIPDLWLSYISDERQNKIRRALPDTLDLLTINVEAGLSFDAAVTRVVENTSGPLVEEFQRMLREIQLGRSRSEALHALMERTKVAELNSFILAVIEADIFGISIGQTLRSQSREMRTRRRQRAEQIAMKTPVKIIFPLVLFIFPAILIVLVGPAGIRIFRALSSL